MSDSTFIPLSTCPDPVVGQVREITTTIQFRDGAGQLVTMEVGDKFIIQRALVRGVTGIGGWFILQADGTRQFLYSGEIHLYSVVVE